MVISWVLKRGLFFQATLVFVLFAFAVFPEGAKAHGGLEATAQFSVVTGTIDTDYGGTPPQGSRHCHSITGQDCSTQVAFIDSSKPVVPATELDLSVPFFDMLSTDCLLSFDPPPPRVRS